MVIKNAKEKKQENQHLRNILFSVIAGASFAFYIDALRQWPGHIKTIDRIIADSFLSFLSPDLATPIIVLVLAGAGAVAIAISWKYIFPRANNGIWGILLVIIAGASPSLVIHIIGTLLLHERADLMYVLGYFGFLALVYLFNQARYDK